MLTGELPVSRTVAETPKLGRGGKAHDQQSMTEWLRLLEVVQRREALHRVDISVPETLQVIHKPCPSTYKAGLELALSSTCLKTLPSSMMLTHGCTWWGFLLDKERLTPPRARRKCSYTNDL